MPDYSMILSDLEQRLTDLQKRIDGSSEWEDTLDEESHGSDELPDVSYERPSAFDVIDDAEAPSNGDDPCNSSMTDSVMNDKKLRPEHEHMRTVIHKDSDSPVPHGYHRVIRTYDNGIPVTWADVPDGRPDPEPMYLCTEAARIYMMSDEEYDEYERMQRRAFRDDIPPSSAYSYPKESKRTPRWAWTTPSPSVKVAATALLMLPCMWIIFIIACLMLWLSYPAFFVTTGGLLLAATSWSLATIVRYPALAESNNPSRKSSQPSLPNRQGSDIDDACTLLSEHVGHAHVGSLAEDGLRQIDVAATKRQQVMSLIDETFASGSLSWNRFAGTVDGTYDTIGQNAIAMADDLRAYDEMRAHEEATRHLSMTRVRNERRQAEDELITSMYQHIQDNEELLLELDKLRQELLRLKGDKCSEHNTTALEEIQRLVAETPEYR